LTVQDLTDFTGAAVTRGVIVNAALCWTEFYNGKWQPTKTSDVNNPTTLGSFDSAGAGAFESLRTAIRLVPAQLMSPLLMQILQITQFTLPGDALILDISIPGKSPDGGFVLHNTHSLPVRFEDIPLTGTVFTPEGVATNLTTSVPLSSVLAAPSPARLFPPPAQPYGGGFGSGTFAIGYLPGQGSQPTHANSLLKYTWQPRYTQPQPWLPDAWDAPFLYEDRRYLFYVTTTESLLPLWRFPGFGILSVSPGLLAFAPAISPVVLRQAVMPATPPEVLAVSATSAAGADPAAVQRFIAAGTNIKAALALPQTVFYQGQVISLTGSVPSGPAASSGQGE
jgi:hypothetical protein